MEHVHFRYYRLHNTVIDLEEVVSFYILDAYLYVRLRNGIELRVNSVAYNGMILQGQYSPSEYLIELQHKIVSYNIEKEREKSRIRYEEEKRKDDRVKVLSESVGNCIREILYLPNGPISREAQTRFENNTHLTLDS